MQYNVKTSVAADTTIHMIRVWLQCDACFIAVLCLSDVNSVVSHLLYLQLVLIGLQNLFCQLFFIHTYLVLLVRLPQ